MASGKFIVLVGVDGSGKTTVADFLGRACRRAGWETIRMHWRPHLLPSPREFVGQKPHSDSSKPHANPPHSIVVSSLLLLYYYLDFILGYLVRVSYAKRRGSMIISERYFYDAVFDPSRHRLKGTNRLARILINLLPQPDILLLLHGDPSVLHSRKSELTRLDVIQQQDRMLEYFQRAQGLIKIDVTCADPPEIVSQVMSVIA